MPFDSYYERHAIQILRDLYGWGKDHCVNTHLLNEPELGLHSTCYHGRKISAVLLWDKEGNLKPTIEAQAIVVSCAKWCRNHNYQLHNQPILSDWRSFRQAINHALYELESTTP